MTAAWDDLNARVRGLQTHLLSRQRLEALCRAPDLAALAEGLRREGVLTGDEAAQILPTDLELAIRRWAGGLLLTLARWTGARTHALTLLFDDEDCRSIRAMLRGAAQRAPAAQRLSGLIPTPTLPERALEVLATSPTPAVVIAHLTTWRHPMAAELAAVVGAAEADLFRLEGAVARAWARKMAVVAGRAHDLLLAGYATESIDLQNAMSAILLTLEGKDVVPSALFLAGGRRVTITVFEEAVAHHDAGRAGERLAIAFAGSPLATVFRHGAHVPAALEAEVLRVRLRVTARQGGQAPLGPIVVAHFALRLRAQVADLRRVVWTVALGAPRIPQAAELVTVAA